MGRRKPDRTIYYHDCKEMGCRVLKDNKEPCQFCGRKKWRIYRKLYESREEKPTLLERLMDKIQVTK